MGILTYGFSAGPHEFEDVMTEICRKIRILSNVPIDWFLIVLDQVRIGFGKAAGS